MRTLISRCWQDDAGFLLSIELLFLAVVLVIGLTAGWAALRSSIITEYVELGGALLGVNEGFTNGATATDTGGAAGSQVLDINGTPPTITAAPNPVTASDANLAPTTQVLNVTNLVP